MNQCNNFTVIHNERMDTYSILIDGILTYDQLSKDEAIQIVTDLMTITWEGKK